MAKKKAVSWYKNVKKDFKKLDSRSKVIIYVAIFILITFGIRALRAGEIEVVGSHTVEELNSVATYIISVSEEGSDKGAVISSVTDSGYALREQLLDFGILESDIKTTNNYIFEKDESQSVRFVVSDEKQWVGGTSLEVRLKDINKVGKFSNTLGEISNLEVYGPTYSIDEMGIDESALLSEAVNDAREKSYYIAKSQNKKLGRVLSISEVSNFNGGVYGDVLGMGGGTAGSSEYSPGSTKIIKSARVKFVLK